MAILMTDLKYLKSTHSCTDSKNTKGSAVESVGGAISGDALVTGKLHDLFDPVTSAEGLAGRTEIRCIYVKNDHATQTLYDTKMFISTNTVSADSTIEIALDPASTGSDSAITLDDELDSGGKLSALTFSASVDFANGLDIGDMPASSYKAIWIKRIINAGAVASLESAVISLQGDSDV